MATEADTKALEALDSIEKAFATTRAVEAELDVDQLCEQYRELKPLIQTALGLIERIPVYGAKIATVIRFLLQIADLVCTVPT